MEAATLLKLRAYLAIAHHIPGRIRLRIKPGLLTDPEALRLAETVDFDAWGNGNNGSSAIINTRLNTQGGSLIVDYDPHQLDPDLIAELFSSKQAERVEQLVEQLADLLGLKL